MSHAAFAFFQTLLVFFNRCHDLRIHQPSVAIATGCGSR
jgi:hypothetical protein